MDTASIISSLFELSAKNAWVTAWNRVVREKLSHLRSWELSTFNGKRKFISEFTEARHWTLP
jgi:hypothetical protein